MIRLSLSALQSGAAGLQVSLSAGGSGPAPIQGSLQFLDPYSGNWQQVGSSSIVGGGGGSLSFDVPAGVPEALPLRLVVTTDAGMFMHLDQMSYSEYQTRLIEDREVSRGQGSAFAGAVNLDLAPMPDAATLETGQTYATLSVPNDVAVPMGVAFSLPALGSNESGVQMQFSGESSGETSVVASLQGFINGAWQEVTSGVVMGSGSFFLDAPVLSAGTQLKLVVQSGSAKFVNVANMDYKTVTKAVQSYVVLSCDTDAAWGLASRGFNGQLRMDEVGAGRGNWYTATYWEYNAPLGRRMNVDPVDQIGISNYSVNRLNPIAFSDPNGDCTDCPEKTGSGNKYSQPDRNSTAELEDVEIKAKGPEGVAVQVGRGVLKGLGQLMKDLAPIRAADPSEPVTPISQIIPRAWENIKNIPTAIKSIPSHLEDIYDNGTVEEKTAATIEAVGMIFSVTKGKPVAPKLGVMIAGESSRGTAAILNAVNEGKRVGSAAVKSANPTDLQHFFSNIVDNYASHGKRFDILGGDGITRHLYQVEGALRGDVGVFEWLVEGAGVSHRRFIKGGVITGTVNQIVK